MAGLQEDDFDALFFGDSDDDLFFPEGPSVLEQIVARHKRLREEAARSQSAGDVFNALLKSSRGGALRARRTQGVPRTARYVDVPDPNTGLLRTGRAMWERDYKSSSWWRDYLNVFKPACHYEEPEHAEQHAVLRREFEHKTRMPLLLFQDLHDIMSEDETMWEDPRKSVPLRVKLAASIRYMALGCTWDAIEEIFHVSKPVLHEWFYNKFLPWIITKMYDEFVFFPQTVDEIREAEEPFSRAGFPGAISQTDGVDFAWSGYSAEERHLMIGKSKIPVVKSNISVDFYGRFQHVSRITFGGEPDVNIIQSDDFQVAILKDDVYCNYEFWLNSPDGGRWFKGVYSLSDNGYGQEGRLVAPFLWEPENSWASRWSRHQKSVRKTVECAFGRLKRQWLVLAGEISCRDMRKVDMMLKACVCLSNAIAVYGGKNDDRAFAEWCHLDDAELEDVNRPRALRATVTAAIEAAKTGEAMNDVSLDCLVLALNEVDPEAVPPDGCLHWTRQAALAKLRRSLATPESLAAAQHADDLEHGEDIHDVPAVDMPVIPRNMTALQLALVKHFKCFKETMSNRPPVPVIPAVVRGNRAVGGL